MILHTVALYTITLHTMTLHLTSLRMKNIRLRMKGFMVLKLDKSKAYDKVDWTFLEGVLRVIDFPVRHGNGAGRDRVLFTPPPPPKPTGVCIYTPSPSSTGVGFIPSCPASDIFIKFY